MDTTHPNPDQRIPGARYRKVRRTITRPVTIAGQTELVTNRETTYVALPPRDWRRIVTAGVVAVTALVVLISLTWTTASIGALLSYGVVAAIAYGAAAVFDLTWIACMGAEWLARYDEDAVRLPRNAGWVALLASMAAVFTHGWLAGSPAVGVVGSSISLLAKGLFVVVMRLTTPQLTAAQRGWLKARVGTVQAQRVLTTAQRGLTRDLAAVTAEQAVLGVAPPETPDSPEAPSGTPEAPETRSGSRELAPQTIHSAILAVAALTPGADDAHVAQGVRDLGIDVDTDTVRTVRSSRTTSPDVSGRVVSIVPERPEAITTIVRRCLLLDPAVGLPAVLAAVQDAHGGAELTPTKCSSVERTLRDERKKASA